MGVTGMLFIFALIHMTFNLRGLLEAFIWNNGEPPVAYFMDLARAPIRIQDTMFVLMSFTADGLLLYRTYAMWGSDWRICLLPTIAYLGTITCGIGSLDRLWKNLSPSDPLNIMTLREWFTPFWILSIISNAGNTILIAWRIYSLSRRTDSKEIDCTHSLAISALIESGALYSLSLLGLVICYQLGLALGQIIASITSQLAAVAPTLIIVRVGLKLPRKHPGLGTDHNIDTRVGFNSCISGIDMNVMAPTKSSWSQKGMVVEISKSTEMVEDEEKDIGDRPLRITEAGKPWSYRETVY